MAFPVNEEFILAEEQRLGASLPLSFREYLKLNNGGEVEAAEDIWQVIPVWDKSDRKRIGRTSNHLSKERDAAKCWNAFPESAVPFAANGTGDLLVFQLLCSGQLADGVYLWNHEQGSMEKLTDNFSELLYGVS
jgi:hypothetical protein